MRLPDFFCRVAAYLNSLVELKSLKLYLTSLRNVGILQEHSVNRILKSLVKLLDPVWMGVSAENGPESEKGGLL